MNRNIIIKASLAILLFTTLLRLDPTNNELLLLELRRISNFKVEYYPVTGNSLAEIRQTLRKIGPIDQHGRRGDAFTKWRIEWRWPFKHGVPNFSKTHTTCDFTVTLPSFDPPYQFKKEWNHFLRTLIIHEFHHVIITEKQCENVTTSIQAAASANPSLTEAEANGIARQVLLQIQHENDEYDRASNHGRLVHRISTGHVP